ncbi:MAG: NAD(P)/FAD-dependent oxidoreductase [Clostridia bacterium]|nr:NAD(P)/FAD-dependent oxidoreductase [Clostridia bacterium]
MKNYVITGNGVAAVGCIEGIRSIDKEGDITVISAEKHHVYSRPLISYLLEGRTDVERMKYRADSFYSDNGCRVIYSRASSFDPGSKTVALDSGGTIYYDELCIATGSCPFVPPFEGLDTVQNKFGFMTLDDALGLENVLTNDSKVLIVGAGLIGLKCAEGIRNRVGSIVVCDLADRVLSSILDSECAAFVQKHLEKNGIEFLLTDSVVKFCGKTAYMKSGRKVEFDVLVLAVGVRANTEMMKSAGGAVNRGIIVDGKMKTSLSCVYAAGDCTEGYDAALGSNRVLAILPNAYMQGFTAGVNMAGGEHTFDNAVPMNSIGFFGLHIMSAGVYTGEVTEYKTDNCIKKFFAGDNLLKGFILIGETGRAGIYTSLIRNFTPLDTIDFEYMKKTASNLIFSQKKRRQMFGGVV